MKVLKSLAIIAALSSLAIAAGAQEVKTTFFLDNYLYGYRHNPSVTPTGTAAFFGLGIGNVSVDVNTNFGLSNFLFPTAEGSLVTGLNSAISSEQFPGGLKKMNRLNASLSENLFAFGTRLGEAGYGHLEINVVSDNHVSVPRSLFEAFKNNNTSGNYLVEDIRFNTTNYIEIAAGWSRRYGDLAVGASLRGLVGIARVDASLDIEIQTTGEAMWGRSKCNLQAAAPILTIATDEEGYYDLGSIGYDRQHIKPAGYGGAVDLGASYYMYDDKLILGAALRNLGLICWNNTISGENTGDKVYVNLEDTDKMTEGLENMIKFRPVTGGAKSKAAMMPLSYNVSARYKPVELVTVGLVATMTHRHGYSSKDLRLGAAFTPFRQFNLAASCAVGDAGVNFGVATSIRLLGLNVYAGVDAIRYKVSPQYIPVNPVSATANVGVAIAIGKAKPKKEKQLVVDEESAL